MCNTHTPLLIALMFLSLWGVGLPSWISSFTSIICSRKSGSAAELSLSLIVSPFSSSYEHRVDKDEDVQGDKHERVVCSICVPQAKPFLPKCSYLWTFTQVMKLSRGWTVYIHKIQNVYKKWKLNIHLAFWVTHPNFDCIIQNPRVTHVEGVLIHITHPVCMVACMGEA